MTNAWAFIGTVVRASVSCQRLWLSATLARCSSAAVCTARARTFTSSNVAQWVEQAAKNCCVEGSTPSIATTLYVVMAGRKAGVRFPLLDASCIRIREAKASHPKRPGSFVDPLRKRGRDETAARTTPCLSMLDMRLVCR